MTAVDSTYPLLDAPATTTREDDKPDLLGPVGLVGPDVLGSVILTSLRAIGAEVEHHPTAASSIARTRLALADCSVLVVCSLTEGDAVQILSDNTGGVLSSLRPGTIVVLHTHVGAERIDELGARCSRYGVVLVEAPVVGRGRYAWSDHPTILVGGSGEAIDVVEPVLRSWAATVMRTGGLGSAARTVLVDELLFAANLQLAGDAVELGLELGLDQSALLEALVACTSSSVSMRIIQGAGTTTSFAKAAERCHAREVTAASAGARSLGADLGLIGDTVRRGQFALITASDQDA